MTKPLILQTDFGLADGAVSAMKGVAHTVSHRIPIFDNTHYIPPYDIWSASYRLWQTINYWPEGSVFVSVVDPGVGSDRKSIVAKTEDGKYIVTPDNGTLTHVYQHQSIIELREIDEELNRLPSSGASHTFHGRDIYAFTGARLAADIIDMEGVGAKLPVDEIVQLPFYHPRRDNDTIIGTIDILDVQFGNLWTNIERELFLELEVSYGEDVEVEIFHESRQIYKNTVTYGRSFASTKVGEPVLYVNSLDNMAIAINQGSFAKGYNIGIGTSWKVILRK